MQPAGGSKGDFATGAVLILHFQMRLMTVLTGRLSIKCQPPVVCAAVQPVSWPVHRHVVDGCCFARGSGFRV